MRMQQLKVLRVSVQAVQHNCASLSGICYTGSHLGQQCMMYIRECIHTYSSSASFELKIGVQKTWVVENTTKGLGTCSRQEAQPKNSPWACLRCDILRSLSLWQIHPEVCSEVQSPAKYAEGSHNQLRNQQSVQPTMPHAL